MTFSGHLACTALSFGVSHNPLVLIPLNLTLHFLADSIPHAELAAFGPATNLRRFVQIADISAALLLIVYISHLPLPHWITISSMLAGLLPDLSDRFARRYLPKLRSFHLLMHTWPLPADETDIDWMKTLTGSTSIWLKVTMQSLLVCCGLLIVRSLH